MDNDKTVRRLSALEKSASTARVLNLVLVHRKHADSAALVQAPLFRNRILDRSIILKHRLRPHEMEVFETPRHAATKILVPIDTSDLRVGARYIFVGQRNFDAIAESVFGKDLLPGQHDRVVIDLIDTLPSLDPFLLRELLRRHDIDPAREYFAITEADIMRMHAYVRQEVSRLVQLSSLDGATSDPMTGERLAEKLLSSNPQSEFEPLKQVLRLSDRDYYDGIFAWRGFLYYKWVLSESTAGLKRVAQQLQTLQPRGPRDPEANAYIPGARKRIASAIGAMWTATKETLSLYDNAYSMLTDEGKPLAFRDFLISAPSMFQTLGEQVGVLQHIVSFWTYRFPANAKTHQVAASELMDILVDFEDSLAREED